MRLKKSQMDYLKKLYGAYLFYVKRVPKSTAIRLSQHDKYYPSLYRCDNVIEFDEACREMNISLDYANDTFEMWLKRDKHSIHDIRQVKYGDLILYRLDSPDDLNIVINKGYGVREYANEKFAEEHPELVTLMANDLRYLLVEYQYKLTNQYSYLRSAIITTLRDKYRLDPNLLSQVFMLDREQITSARSLQSYANYEGIFYPFNSRQRIAHLIYNSIRK